MARTLFFCMVLRKFSKITNSKPIYSQYNTCYKRKYFFFQSAFWSLFNRRQKIQSNQEQCGLCCSSPCFCVLLCTHYGPLQCFSTYFCKLKEIGVIQPIFPDYVISCYYDAIQIIHCKDRFTHARELFRKSEILNVFQLNTWKGCNKAYFS